MKTLILLLACCCFGSVLLGYEHQTGQPFFLPQKSFQTHLHLMGGTGKGKTTAIEAILHQIFRAKERASHFILDRMGSFSLSLKLWFASPYCPDYVRERVVYLEAAREDVVMPFNPLQHTSIGEGYFKVGRACEVILRAWASQNIQEMPRLARWTHNAMWASSRANAS